MDSTLIRAEVIDELAVEAGVGEKVKLITEKAMQGELNFDESLRARVALLQGLSESALEKVFNRIAFNPGVTECLEKLHSHGIKTAIASGGFRYFAQLFAARLKMDFCFANDLEIQAGVLTGKISGDILNAQTKAEILTTLARQLNLSLSQVVAVGDGANDLLMLKAAGLGVAFHAKEKVQQEAGAIINFGTMETLLDFIGISRGAKDAF
jgi:phosphoserine phosphatase